MGAVDMAAVDAAAAVAAVAMCICMSECRTSHAPEPSLLSSIEFTMAK